MTGKAKPGYLSKHPCEACGVGYGDCASGWVHNLQCCRACAHPTRWQPNPWTEEDIAEMQAINARRGGHPVPEESA